MRLTEAIKAAERLGLQHGGNAADWFWDRTEPTLADYRKVLKGIRDGDPEIMDLFPGNPLSGENADDMTPQKLWSEIGLSEANRRAWHQTPDLDEICTAYETGFNSGYSHAVESSCEEGLRRRVTFVIGVEIEDQDEHQLLSELTDHLAKRNCSLEDDRILDENDEEVRAA